MFGSRRLEQNSIKVIPAGAFSPYKKLRRMWVDEEIGILCSLSTIHKINVCSCPVCGMSWPSYFTFCVSIFFYLYLWFCTFLSRVSLCPVLHRDLSNNQISELASDAFQGLRSLNSLWVLQTGHLRHGFNLFLQQYNVHFSLAAWLWSCSALKQIW